jgi:hypothetical protein
MATVTIEIPDQLADQAQAMGLLRSDALTTLLREAISRNEIADMFAAADRLAELDLPVMTTEEIQSEILEARAKRAGRP